MRALEFTTGHMIYKPVYTYIQIPTENHQRPEKLIYYDFRRFSKGIGSAWEIKCNEKLCFLQAIYLQCRAYLVTISKTIS